ncbi:MAG: cytochrome c [Chitinophagaceae bacterium]|nr:cytochrome c [Chitinophagaceae bacterium]
MKKIFIIAGITGIIATLVGCGGNSQPGRAYMPDMAYSVAYETYTDASERLKHSGVEGGEVYFDGKPVAGTVARGDMPAYPYKNDSLGYALSKNVKNPVDAASVNLKEAERLYLINCGICHGAKLDGNGPLYNDGKGPFSAMPKNLMGDDMKAMAEGTMFHSITYGIRAMGSYASQLSTRQRWEVITYIRSKQFPAGAVAAPDTAAAKTTVSAVAKAK